MISFAHINIQNSILLHPKCQHLNIFPSSKIVKMEDLIVKKVLWNSASNQKYIIVPINSHIPKGQSVVVLPLKVEHFHKLFIVKSDEELSGLIREIMQFNSELIDQHRKKEFEVSQHG